VEDRTQGIATGRRRVGLRRAVALALLALPACQSAKAPPSGAHEGLNAILWMQTAAEYEAASRQAFRTAAAHLELALADPSWTAAPEQTGDFAALPPAIVLDMDETIVRSDHFQAGLVAAGEPFRLEAWNDWVRSQDARAMPGALDYVRAAQARGVHVFYITNRTAEVEAPSLATLLELGFPVAGGADDLLTLNEQPDWGQDKSSRRARICESHRILQVVGDNLNDFTSGADEAVAARNALARRYERYWGSRWILTPNPAYGGWEGALFDYEWALPREKQLERKRRWLRTWR